MLITGKNVQHHATQSLISPVKGEKCINSLQFNFASFSFDEKLQQIAQRTDAIDIMHTKPFYLLSS